MWQFIKYTRVSKRGEPAIALARSSLFGVVLEAVIGVAFSEPTWPAVLRIGETFNTGFDGIARGVSITLLLALPALSEKRQGAVAEDTAGHGRGERDQSG